MADDNRWKRLADEYFKGSIVPILFLLGFVILAMFFSYETRLEPNYIQTCNLYNSSMGCFGGNVNGTMCCIPSLKYYRADQVVPVSNFTPGMTISMLLLAVGLYMTMKKEDSITNRIYLPEARLIVKHYMEDNKDDLHITDNDVIKVTPFGKDQAKEDRETSQMMPEKIYVQAMIIKDTGGNQRFIAEVDPYVHKVKRFEETQFDMRFNDGQQLADVIMWQETPEMMKEKRARQKLGLTGKQGFN